MIVDAITLRQWVSHQARAEAEGITCWKLPETPTWTVTSGTVPGLLYRVRLTVNSNGSDLACDCEAGRIPTLCKHLYVAAVAAGLLDPQAVAAEASRIRHDQRGERARTQAAKRAERLRERERRRLVEMASNALTVGARVRVKQRGLPPALGPWRGIEGIVEAIYPTGLLQISFGNPTTRIYLSPDLVQRSREEGPLTSGE